MYYPLIYTSIITMDHSNIKQNRVKINIAMNELSDETATKTKYDNHCENV